MIDKTKSSNGFNGSETERELLFYVIGKLDDFNDKNNTQHTEIFKFISGCDNKVTTNKQHIKYVKLGIYGIGITVLFILNILFSVF